MELARAEEEQAEWRQTMADQLLEQEVVYFGIITIIWASSQFLVAFGHHHKLHQTALVRSSMQTSGSWCIARPLSTTATLPFALLKRCTHIDASSLIIANRGF